MKIRTLLFSAATSLLVMGLSQPTATAQPQLSLTGTNYTEGFESIAGGSLPPGWSSRFNASATAVGDEIPFTNGVSSWAGATIGLPYDMASTFNIDPATSNLFVGTESSATQSSAANRAPGMRLSSGTDGEVTWTLQIADTIGLADFTVSMDLLIFTDKSRTGEWTVDYAVGDAPSSFTPLGSMSDLPGRAFGATNSTALVIPSDADNQGQNLWIRLALLTDTAPSGTRDTYGIDNFILNYTGGVVNTDPPSITSHPVSSTNNAGETAVFMVEAEGAPILSYQWRKGGANIGAPSLAGLSVPDIVSADAGAYNVVITNAFGSVTSSVATLTVVNDPGLAVAFAGLTNMPGDAISLDADVGGTVPMSVQWLQDGVEVGGASGVLSNVNSTTSFLVTTNAAPADAGTYSVTVSNSVGVVTAAVATVTLVQAPSTRLASWDFNSLANDDDDTTGVDTPAVGAGTLFLAPLSTSFEYRGGAPTDVADLAVTNDNSAYRARGVNTGFNLESGLEVRVDTTGFQDILVSWNENHNTRGSRYMRFQYSTDGSTFTDATGYSFADRDGTWILQTEALYGIAGVENNPNFAFRIVAEWESTAIGTTNEVYAAAASGSNFSAANGVMIFDQLTVWGNPIGSAEAPITVTGFGVSGGSVVTFSSAPWDAPGEFNLLNTSSAEGTYTNQVGASISDVSPGNFQADTPVGGSQEFYSIGR